MITQLTYRLAYEIASDRIELANYTRNAKHNEWIQFTHTGFFYSFIDGQPIYHKVETACNCCRQKPDRNYGGYGTLYLMPTNTPKRDFVLFCKSCKDWRDTRKFTNPKLPLQYQLF